MVTPNPNKNGPGKKKDVQCQLLFPFNCASILAITYDLGFFFKVSPEIFFGALWCFVLGVHHISKDTFLLDLAIRIRIQSLIEFRSIPEPLEKYGSGPYPCKRKTAIRCKTLGIHYSSHLSTFYNMCMIEPYFSSFQFKQ